MLRLDIKQLRLVKTIADTKNITHAAAQLHLSQPALSKQLMELESRLGFPLFLRTRKAMVLTEPGHSFYRHAERILQDILVMEEQMAKFSGGASGRLRISIDRVHQSDWLSPVMGRFRKLYPQVDLEVVQVDRLLESLTAQKIDLAILGEALPTCGLNYVPLQDDEIIAIVHRKHPLAKKPYLRVNDLQGQDFVYYFKLEGSYLHQRYLQPNNVTLGRFHRIQDLEALVSMVESGDGMSILPRNLVANALADGRVEEVRIGNYGFHFSWHAAFRAETAKPYLKEFVDLILQQIEGSGRHSSGIRAIEVKPAIQASAKSGLVR
ncbi:hypothetical protein BTA51_07020 [Hahella sp. CCB-MM4]|uniref:LysR family transcriptional regulator n=1 Tax=Hahella sp. (strain CCB-MM4) TaxID=1926491 RepID=UPI000B9AA673|nr:LysR family transcriptional regulator [Hahella sp. CCB-MM4]OZG74719.1 hypothetical protein BTA51_07020 [Hahella sp. CCB-MM4]